MGGWIPSLRHREASGHRGLGLLPGLSVIPHFDRFIPRMGASLAQLALRPPAGIEVIGIDELTALVGSKTTLTVLGKGNVFRLDDKPASRHTEGAVIKLS
ncbi:hypothetical protein FEAC_24560 [Ferrimicrobium acidiphilum DSM 19497]|uniref:Cyanophycinase n=1 Tax=Ferrimicrobium acidiphilum DSM 19497 TaxID=1121877 RepID=A0A0D8FRD4_9ACTN|nr:hypothetical protein FEAC_24560 [Ferrimicrobium acidiphilum DSM 19497]